MPYIFVRFCQWHQACVWVVWRSKHTDLGLHFKINLLLWRDLEIISLEHCIVNLDWFFVNFVVWLWLRNVSDSPLILFFILCLRGKEKDRNKKLDSLNAQHKWSHSFYNDFAPLALPSRLNRQFKKEWAQKNTTIVEVIESIWI